MRVEPILNSFDRLSCARAKDAQEKKENSLTMHKKPISYMDFAGANPKGFATPIQRELV